jgi:hypothetical protein
MMRGALENIFFAARCLLTNVMVRPIPGLLILAQPGGMEVATVE